MGSGRSLSCSSFAFCTVAMASAASIVCCSGLERASHPGDVNWMTRFTTIWALRLGGAWEGAWELTGVKTRINRRIEFHRRDWIEKTN